MSEKPESILELLFYDESGQPFMVGSFTRDSRGLTKMGVARDLADQYMAFNRVPRVDIRRRDRQESGRYADGPVIESWTDRGALINSKYRTYTEHGRWFSDELPDSKP